MFYHKVSLGVFFSCVAVIVAKKEPVKGTGIPCPVINNCPSHQFSYYVQSGQGVERPPVICYNNEL